MTLPCCTIDLEGFAPVRLEGDEAARWVSAVGPGLKRIEFIVPQANCAACMPDIEGRIGAIAGVQSVRVNLTGRRVAVIGPYTGLPSGLQLWGTAVDMPYLFGPVTKIATATTFVIP